MKNKICIFDFDGTISDINSFTYFTYFSVKKYQAILYWMKVVFLCFFTANHVLKEMFFNYFESDPIEEFDKKCDFFFNKILKKSIKESFLDYLDSLDSGTHIVVVSASINNYLKPWCVDMGFDLISSELEVINGKLTGKFSRLNCNGIEKVRRINERYDLSQYNEIHVFGNSKGDLPMLELGTHKYFKFFK